MLGTEQYPIELSIAQLAVWLVLLRPNLTIAKLHCCYNGWVHGVNLHFGEGQLQVEVRAERPETLHLLQREADGFERSLRQAGLELKDGGLQFSAQGDGGRQRSGEGGSLWHGLAREEGKAATAEAGTERRGIRQPLLTAPQAWQPTVSDHLDVRL